MDGDLIGKMQALMNDPESMQQISELAQMLRTESAPEAASSDAPAANSPPPADGLDPGMLLQLGQLMHSTGESDKNTALLLALKPHLSPRRCERVDKAMRLLRLWSMFQTLQKSGMLQNLL